MAGRKQLKGLACSLAHKFAWSAEHYGWLASLHQISLVTIDLLTLTIAPDEFDIERNRILVRMCHATLMGNIERLTPPAAVISAVLTAQFGIDVCEGSIVYPRISNSVFTVTLTDDRGKLWCGEYREERMRICR